MNSDWWIDETRPIPGDEFELEPAGSRNMTAERCSNSPSGFNDEHMFVYRSNLLTATATSVTTEVYCINCGLEPTNSAKGYCVVTGKLEHVMSHPWNGISVCMNCGWYAG